jgi:hypothetical protein
MEIDEAIAWIQGNLPQTILLIGGILAMAIAIKYAKDKDGKYVVLTAAGFIFGVGMLIEAVARYSEWSTFAAILIAITAFALIIRPFRNVNFSAIAALLLMAIVYIALGGLNGVMIADAIDLTFLSEGWPRIIISLIVGAIVYGLCRFAESSVKLFGKLLNLWPILLLLGITCVAEAVMMFAGVGSVSDFMDFESLRTRLGF